MQASHVLQPIRIFARTWRASVQILAVQTIFFYSLIVPTNVIAGTLKLYWSDGDIHRANLDGTDAEDIVQSPAGDFPNIAFDPVEKKMYWPSASAGAIERANYDGTDVETVVSGISMLRNVAIDASNRKVYWIDVGQPNSIWRSNVDGTSRELLFSTTSSTPLDVAVDPERGYYYWSGFRGDIHRKSIDGSESFSTNFGGPSGTLAIDSNNGYLYESRNDEILRMRLDLSEPTVWLPQNNLSPGGIVVDSANGRLMWANYQFLYDGRDILSMNLNGTDEQTIFFPRSGESSATNGWTFLAILDVATPEPSSATLAFAAGTMMLLSYRRLATSRFR
jgi:hypothetical protein